MKRIKILQWEIEVNRENTIQTYESLTVNQCTCSDCLNFHKAIELIDQNDLEVFKSLEIDIRKAYEIYSLYQQEENIIVYGGFCFITGRLLEGNDCYQLITATSTKIRHFKLEKLNDTVEIGFRQELSLTPDLFEPPLLQVEFTIKLPYIS